MKPFSASAFITLLSLAFSVLAIVGLCRDNISSTLASLHACTAAILAALAMIQGNIAKIK